jgi:PST family polysaccharide transporter
VKRLLKVTALMSSVTVITLFFNLLKNKAIAVLVGPSGIGLYSLFMSLYTTMVSLTSIASGGSVVKAIAEANSKNDKPKLYAIKKILTFLAIAIGVSIGFLVFIFREKLSQWAFGSPLYADEIKLIGFVIIFAIFANFWQSWLNGLREIRMIAKIRVYTTIVVSTISIVLVYFYRLDGIIYSVILVPIVGFIFAAWAFKKKVFFSHYNLKLSDYKSTANEVLKIGLVLLLISLLFQVGVYINRSIISNKMGIESLGVFFAAWTISMSYLEIFLSSLSVDYYPRLVENKDNQESYIKIVNEQLFFSLLMIFPLILFVYIYAPYIIALLFSHEFVEAVVILKWQIIGDLFKVFVWIFGYLLIVHSSLKYSLFVQLIWVVGYTGLVWFGLDQWGLSITGIAFFISYFISFILLYIYVKVKYKFIFTYENRGLFVFMTVAIVILVLPFNDMWFFVVQNFILLVAVSYTIVKMKGKIYGQKK